MKWIFLIAIMLPIVFIGFGVPNKNQAKDPFEDERVINSILGKTAKIIKEKYNLRPSGIGVAMPGGPIREVTLCFDTQDVLSKEELRKLLINSAQEMLKQVNENEEVQQFLKTRPFTMNNVEVIIYNHDKTNSDVRDPEISTAHISQGELVYRTTDPENDFRFKNRFKESYEDALKALPANLIDQGTKS